MKNSENRQKAIMAAWDNMWPPLLTLGIALIVWESSVHIFQISPLVIPAPTSIFAELIKYFRVELLDDWLTTTGIIGMGYLTGVPTGILIASLLSQSKLATKAFTPLIILLVTLPTMVVIPIFMVWAGYEVKYRAILVFFQVAAILALNTLSGFQNIDKSKLDLAAGYGASKWQTFIKVIFPNALPEVFQGLRLGCSFSILNVIGTEFIAGKIGIGFSVQYFSGLLKMPIAWGCILVVGLTGRAMFMIVQILEKRIVTWKR